MEKKEHLDASLESLLFTTKNICEICKTTTNMYCKRCKCTYYCSEEHQLQDLRYHAEVCYPPTQIYITMENFDTEELLNSDFVIIDDEALPKERLEQHGVQKEEEEEKEQEEEEEEEGKREEEQEGEGEGNKEGDHARTKVSRTYPVLATFRGRKRGREVVQKLEGPVKRMKAFVMNAFTVASVIGTGALKCLGIITTQKYSDRWRLAQNINRARTANEEIIARAKLDFHDKFLEKKEETAKEMKYYLEKKVRELANNINGNLDPENIKLRNDVDSLRNNTLSYSDIIRSFLEQKTKIFEAFSFVSDPRNEMVLGTKLRVMLHRYGTTKVQEDWRYLDLCISTMKIHQNIDVILGRICAPGVPSEYEGYMAALEDCATILVSLAKVTRRYLSALCEYNIDDDSIQNRDHRIRMIAEITSEISLLVMKSGHLTSTVSDNGPIEPGVLLKGLWSFAKGFAKIIFYFTRLVMRYLPFTFWVFMSLGSAFLDKNNEPYLDQIAKSLHIYLKTESITIPEAAQKKFDQGMSPSLVSVREGMLKTGYLVGAAGRHVVLENGGVLLESYRKSWTNGLWDTASFVVNGTTSLLSGGTIATKEAVIIPYKFLTEEYAVALNYASGTIESGMGNVYEFLTGRSYAAIPPVPVLPPRECFGSTNGDVVATCDGLAKACLWAIVKTDAVRNVMYNLSGYVQEMWIATIMHEYGLTSYMFRITGQSLLMYATNMFISYIGKKLWNVGKRKVELLVETHESNKYIRKEIEMQHYLADKLVKKYDLLKSPNYLHEEILAQQQMPSPPHPEFNATNDLSSLAFFPPLPPAGTYAELLNAAKNTPEIYTPMRRR